MIRYLALAVVLTLVPSCKKKSEFSGGTKSSKAEPVEEEESEDAEPIMEEEEEPIEEEEEVPEGFVPTVEVGINFEDQPDQPNADYNVAVLCFKGKFNVSDSEIVSSEAQTIHAALHKRANCSLDLEVKIVRDGKTVRTETYNMNQGSSMDIEAKDLKFKDGDQLVVDLISRSPDCGMDRRSSMTDTKAAKIGAVCNNTGD